MQSWGFEGSVNWSILTDWKEAEQFYWRQGHTWGQGSLGYYAYLNLVISGTAFIVDLTCCVWSISRREIFSQSWPSNFLLLLLLRVEWTLHRQEVWRQFPKFHPLTSVYFSLICSFCLSIFSMIWSTGMRRSSLISFFINSSRQSVIYLSISLQIVIVFCVFN